MTEPGWTTQLFRRTAWIAAAFALGAAGACSDSLVDHSAPADVVNPSGCAAGQALCGAVCVAEDAGHCGSSCAACAAAPDPNAAAVCTEAHECAFACNPGW